MKLDDVSHIRHLGNCTQVRQDIPRCLKRMGRAFTVKMSAPFEFSTQMNVWYALTKYIVKMEVQK